MTATHPLVAVLIRLEAKQNCRSATAPKLVIAGPICVTRRLTFWAGGGQPVALGESLEMVIIDKPLVSHDKARHWLSGVPPTEQNNISTLADKDMKASFQRVVPDSSRLSFKVCPISGNIEKLRVGRGGG